MVAARILLRSHVVCSIVQRHAGGRRAPAAAASFALQGQRESDQAVDHRVAEDDDESVSSRSCGSRPSSWLQEMAPPLYRGAMPRHSRVTQQQRRVHLGDVKSLITHPASTTHRNLPQEDREAIGITEGLLRLSIGLEDEADLIADLAGTIA